MACWAASEARRPGEVRRWAHRRRADLQRDHLALLEHDRARVACERLRRASTVSRHENGESFGAGERDCRDVTAIQELLLSAPRSPHLEEVARGDARSPGALMWVTPASPLCIWGQ